MLSRFSRFKINVAAGLVSQSASILCALICLPITLRTVGEAEFGTIALIISVMALMGVFDAGLGRATTKIVAENHGDAGIERAATFLWASITIQFVLGVGFALVARFYLLTSDFGPMRQFTTDVQAQKLFVTVAPCLPFLVIIGSLRGALEGNRRFILVAAVKWIQNSTLYIIPAILGTLGCNLTTIISALALSRVVCALIYLICCVRCFGTIFRFKRKYLIQDIHTVKFIAWLSISSIAVTLLTNIDRITLGGISGPQELAIYVLSMEIINGLGLLPGAISTVLLPQFAGKNIAGDRTASNLLLLKNGLRAICLVILPIVVIVAFYSQFLLMVWQNAPLAEKAHWVFFTGVIAAFFNAVGWIPTTFLIGNGRTKIIALTQLIQLPFQAIFLFIFCRKYGAEGAMTVFLVRVVLETGVLFYALGKIPDLCGAGYRFGIFLRYATQDWRLVLLCTPILCLSKLVTDGHMLATFAGIVIYGILCAGLGWNRMLRKGAKL